jgi:hypothetical protein
MVDNAIAFFYPGESSSEARTPQMLDSQSTRSQETIVQSNSRNPEVSIPQSRLGRDG